MRLAHRLRAPGSLLGALALAALAAQGMAQDGSSPDPLAGELLLGELHCSACHAATPELEARLQPKAAPHLARVGARVAPEYLRRYLTDPQAAKPGATMPDLLTHLSEELRAPVVDELVHYLVSLGGPLDMAPTEVRLGELEPGRRLFHEVGCVACHEPQEEPWELELGLLERLSQEAEESDADEEPRGADGEEELYVPPGVPEPPRVPLGDLARKTTVGALAEVLVDPLAVWPSGRMPSLKLSTSEARQIALYLLRDQAHLAAGAVEELQGLAVDYFEAPFTDEVADFEALEPVRGESVERIAGLPPHRPDHFGFRFSGTLRIDRAGEYTFFTSSDDGSRLLVDGQPVVRNDGFHGMQEAAGAVYLDAGRHALEVTMFERDGGEGLEVRWSGPGVPKQEIPAERLSYAAFTLRPRGAGAFALDLEKAARGAELFGSLGCAACHETTDGGGTSAPPLAKPLARLEHDAAGGCLSPAPRPGAARYALSGEQRTALRDVLARPGSLGGPLTASERIDRTLERFRCVACHARQGFGGPHPERRPYFLIRGNYDIGDEGRIPPHLDEPGSKLTPEWLDAILFEGGSSRPYMATRMPQFGRENLGRLAHAFRDVDARPDDLVAPAFDIGLVEAGRRLVGTDGLGCIQCHRFAGHESLGIPAVDLAEVHRRVQPGWFERLLRDPISINMNTRMPEFWAKGVSPVQDVLAGDIESQIDAMWTYLSLGHSMPLPVGLVVPDAEYELVVGDRPRTCGVFMKGVSPRTLVVGFPEHTHYAYDVQGSRLAKAWRGRFFNARGTWHARAGALQEPPSEDTYDLPAEPPFARLPDPDAPWPVGHGVQDGYRVLGRRFDAERRPVFRYALGGVEIEERIQPELREGGSWLVRRFVLRSAGPVDDIWYFCHSGDGRGLTLQVGPSEPGAQPGHPRRLVVAAGVDMPLRIRPERGETIARVRFRPAPEGGYVARFEDEFTW